MKKNVHISRAAGDEVLVWFGWLWLVGEGDGRPWRSRVRAVVCDRAE